MNREEYLSCAYQFASLGEKNASAKLTDAQVISIRQRHVPHSRQNSVAAIARDTGVPFSTVRKVIERRTWAHLP